MASDTTKKKKTATADTTKTTKKTSTTSTAKKGTATKTNTKKESTTASASKASTNKKSQKSDVKTTTKKTTTTKKAPTSAPGKTKSVTKKVETAEKPKINKNDKVSRASKVVTETKPVSTKKKSTPKVKVQPIEREDLEETREADLAKTVILNPEILQELQNEEIEVPDIDNIKIEKPKNTKKDQEIVARTILGIDLPSNMTTEDRKERKKFYVKDALIFAIIIPILDLFAMLFIDSYTYLMITNSAPLNYLMTLLLDFILIFLVTYLIDYIFGEDAVKRINR